MKTSEYKMLSVSVLYYKLEMLKGEIVWHSFVCIEVEMYHCMLTVLLYQYNRTVTLILNDNNLYTFLNL